MMETTLIVIFISGYVSCLVLWVGVILYGIRMIMGRKEGIRIFDKRIGYNGLNLSYHPEYLTEKGLKARNRRFICAVAFPVLIIITAIIVLIFGPIKS